MDKVLSEFLKFALPCECSCGAQGERGEGYGISCNINISRDDFMELLRKNSENNPDLAELYAEMSRGM